MLQVMQSKGTNVIFFGKNNLEYFLETHHFGGSLFPRIVFLLMAIVDDRKCQRVDTPKFWALSGQNSIAETKFAK